MRCQKLLLLYLQRLQGIKRITLCEALHCFPSKWGNVQESGRMGLLMTIAYGHWVQQRRPLSWAAWTRLGLPSSWKTPRPFAVSDLGSGTSPGMPCDTHPLLSFWLESRRAGQSLPAHPTFSRSPARPKPSPHQGYAHICFCDILSTSRIFSKH